MPKALRSARAGVCGLCCFIAALAALAAPAFAQATQPFITIADPVAAPADTGHDATPPADSMLAFEVFADQWAPDAATTAKVDALVVELGRGDFHSRGQAQDELAGLGENAAVVLMHLDRTTLNPEQTIRIDKLLAPYLPVTAEQAKKLRTDPAFLLDCLSSDDLVIRKAAFAQLQSATKLKLNFDPAAAAPVRTTAISAIVRQLVDAKVVLGLGPRGPVFGDGGSAAKITFLCDASGSMMEKMEALKRELSKTVEALDPVEKFSIIFMQNEDPTYLDKDLIFATPANKRKAESFLADVSTNGSTDPIPAIDLAFKQHPQLIYLLTDGDFPDNARLLAEIHQLDPNHTVRINTISFTDSADHDVDFKKLLKTIADESGGKYKEVNEEQLN